MQEFIDKIKEKSFTLANKEIITVEKAIAILEEAYNHAFIKGEESMVNLVDKLIKK